MSKHYSVLLSLLFLSVITYAVYQFSTRNDTLSSVDDLTEQVVIQKIIVAIMLAGMVVMSFAFSQQIKRFGNATGAN